MRESTVFQWLGIHFDNGVCSVDGGLVANGARPNLDGHVDVRSKQVHTASSGTLFHGDGAVEWSKMFRLLVKEHAPEWWDP